MAKENERIIPRKNYYLLFLLTVITIFILWYCVIWYQQRQKFEFITSNVSEIVSEVKQEELKNYLLDNSNVVIYFTSFQDKNIKSFEKSFKKYILKHELTNEIVVVDTDKIEGQEFYNKFVDEYFVDELKNKNVDLKYLPNMVILKDGKARSILVTYDTKITMDEVKHFLEKNEVVE